MCVYHLKTIKWCVSVLFGNQLSLSISTAKSVETLSYENVETGIYESQDAVIQFSVNDQEGYYRVSTLRYMFYFYASPFGGELLVFKPKVKALGFQYPFNEVNPSVF